MTKKDKRSKELPKLEGAQTEVSGALPASHEHPEAKGKKLKLRAAIDIVLDLAASAIIDPSLDAAADVDVSKRQERAVTRVRKFLDKALYAREEGRI